MATQPTYDDLKQRISFLEQELHDKNEQPTLLTSNFEHELNWPGKKPWKENKIYRI